MDIIVTRSRIAGTLPFYEYRALAPLDALCPERRRLVCPVMPRALADVGPCVSIAQVIAPDAWFDLGHAERARRGCNIIIVAKRVEAVLVRAHFPEMTRKVIPVITQLDHDLGAGRGWIASDDLTGRFAQLSAAMPAIQPEDLGLSGSERLAA